MWGDILLGILCSWACAVADTRSTLPNQAVGFERENWRHRHPESEIAALGSPHDPWKATRRLLDSPSTPAPRPADTQMPVPYSLAFRSRRLHSKAAQG